MLLLFFYLYLYPFGYSKEYVITKDNILEESKEIHFSQGQKESNGLLHITIEPKLRVRNLFSEMSIKGENVYILSPNVVKLGNYDEIWDYIRKDFDVEKIKESKKSSDTQFNDYNYSVLRDYNVKDSNLIAFYINWESLPENRDTDNQLLLKYEDLRILQHTESLELRVDRVYNGNIYTYQIGALIGSEKNELIAIYSKPVEEENGYIELIVNDTRIGRAIVSSPYNLFEDYNPLDEEPLNEQLAKDLNQEKISLGQELYRVDLEKSFPNHLLGSIDLNTYYLNTYLYPLLERKEENYTPSLSEYYEKPFFNYFKGNIYELRVAYEYPFEMIEEEERFVGHSPFVVSFIGKTEDIEKIIIKTTREPIWRKLKNL